MKKIILTTFVSLAFLLASEIYAQLPAPVLLYPTNGAPNVQQPIDFDWTDVTGATGYRLQIYDVNQNLIVDTTSLPLSHCIVPLGILAPNTQYHWRASAVNGLWSGFWSFTTAMSAPSPPTLLYPPNNATNVSTTPTFDWTDVPGATTYHLQVSLDANFTNLPINIPGLVSSQHVVTISNPLANGTQYWWRVRASNLGGNSNWSTIWTFSTVPAPPPPPNLIYPANGSSNISLTPTMDWSDVTGATRYLLQIATDNNFLNIVWSRDSLINSNYPVPAGVLSGTTVYYWRVASANVAGQGAWSMVWSFTTMVGPPAAPILLVPPNGSTNISRLPLFDWNDVPTAMNYTIHVSTDPNFTPPLVIDQTVSYSQYQATTVLNYNTTYYWRVRATNSGGPGQWSSVWSFKTVPALPPPPTLLLPPNGVTNVSLTPFMDWTDVPEATSYRLQISSNSNFTGLVLNTVLTPSCYDVPSGILAGGQRYYWRVYSINAAGQNPISSSVWFFDTKQTLATNIRVLLEGFYNALTLQQVQDTICILLANSSPPYNFVDSANACLSAQGCDTASFEFAPNGNYYIVVRHRNHLETWSSVPQSFVTGNPVNYDFTTASNKAYGNNMKPVGSVWVFWGGDADQDGSVLIVNDYNLFKQNFGQDGYLSPDFNGDKYVDGYDLSILYNNFFKSKARP